MARVVGHVWIEETEEFEVVYNEECRQDEVNQHIMNALDCWGSIHECGKVDVLVIDDDGTRWSPE